jgi:hypothetical protein
LIKHGDTRLAYDFARYQFAGAVNRELDDHRPVQMARHCVFGIAFEPLDMGGNPCPPSYQGGGAQ